jgi:molybdopterin-binding protein
VPVTHCGLFPAGWEAGIVGGMARTAAGSDLITADEAAALLHLHVKRVQLLAREGKIPAVRHGRRWLFSREHLVEGRTARETAASDERAVDISARNQIRGRIKSVTADGLMAEVTMSIQPQDLVAVITRGSAQRLGLAPGVEAVAVMKSTEVMIARRRG